MTGGYTIGRANQRMSQDDVTEWLLAWGAGDPTANSRLIEAVYADLRRSRAGASVPIAAIIP